MILQVYDYFPLQNQNARCQVTVLVIDEKMKKTSRYSTLIRKLYWIRTGRCQYDPCLQFCLTRLLSWQLSAVHTTKLPSLALQLRDLLSTAQDHFLTDKVISTIQERYTDDETGCVQLLVCKSSPFVWGMQRAVRALLNNEEDTKGRNRLTPIQTMYRDMPSVDEVAENGDKCEDRFPACRILPPELGES